MKKIFVFLLLIAVVFSLSACRKNDVVFSSQGFASSIITTSEISDTVSDVSSEDDVSDTTQEITSTTETVSSEPTITAPTVPSSSQPTPTNPVVNETVNSTIEDVKDKVDDIIPELPSVPQVPTSSTESPSDEVITPNIPVEDLFKFGTFNGNTYESLFWNIGCTLGEDWSMLTEAEILEYNGISSSATEQEINEHISNSFLIIDMIAAKEDGKSVAMALTMSDLGSGSFAQLDLNEYMNTVVETSKESLVQSGFSNMVVERKDLTIDGKLFHSAAMSGTLDGVNVYQTIICIKNDYYLTMIELTTTTEEEMLYIIDNLYIPQG
ncbi:MAG: hypothetical protein E7521_08095 [Ruminococcaceae bacterium]|nr:hypothetical protein [Oscillospiraceae bacterium]